MTVSLRTIERRRPSWFSSFRPAQADIIDQSVEAFERGQRTVICEAPPGSGKSLSAVEIGQRLGVQTVYTCTTKQLQSQAESDFPWGRLLQGRANYPTEFGGPDVTCEDCLGEACGYCTSSLTCPYTVQKRRTIMADLPILNTAYILREINQPKSAFSGSDFIVIDEVDVLTQVLMGFIEVAVSPRMQSHLGIKPPSKKTVERTWPDWLHSTQKACGRFLGRTRHAEDVQTRRLRRAVSRLASNIGACLDDLAEEDVSWIYDYSTTDDNRTPYVVFRPVLIDHLTNGYLWRHGKRFLLMSATIISHDVMAADLGVGDNWTGLTAPWTFPAENRPIYVKGVADMTRAKRDEEWPKMAEGVREILTFIPNERVLVHCVSYDLAAYLTASLDSQRVVTYRTAAQRVEALDRYRETRGAVLIAPSMERGVDLPDDMCRYQLVCKVPYPNLGDRLINARFRARGGTVWYATQTIRSLVQATGRPVRHDEDWAVTIILDRQFLKLWDTWGHLMPSGWKEAVQFKSAGVASMVNREE